ncbi:hypothetical protein AGMMS49975_30220 [Clostridia bacterium]|nr:hypothetical protein AGMMS49975_30220 [Clostridia bacterium]
MSIADIFSMAVRNLFKRKMRTFLTVLGVVIGTASIVVMVSLGIGMNNNFKNSMEQMGDLLVANIYLPWQDSNVKNPNPVTIDARLWKG